MTLFAPPLCDVPPYAMPKGASHTMVLEAGSIGDALDQAREQHAAEEDDEYYDDE